uniref:Putative flavin-containing monooxygenase Passenger gene of insertion sequence ISCARN83,IS1595 family ISNwi1 group n=1 Tax=mine drainage metagenome TaxID=410659 RepID=E6QIP1_9ZZZZ
MTEKQAEKIIEILKQILRELEEFHREYDQK